MQFYPFKKIVTNFAAVFQLLGYFAKCKWPLQFWSTHLQYSMTFFKSKIRNEFKDPRWRIGFPNSIASCEKDFGHSLSVKVKTKTEWTSTKTNSEANKEKLSGLRFIEYLLFSCEKTRRSHSLFINYSGCTTWSSWLHWWRQLPSTNWLPVWSHVQSLHWIQFFALTIGSPNDIDMVVDSSKTRCCTITETNPNNLFLKVANHYRKQ